MEINNKQVELEIQELFEEYKKGEMSSNELQRNILCTILGHQWEGNKCLRCGKRL